MGLPANFWDTVGDVGSVASQAAAGRATGRVSEANLGQNADKIAVERYLAQLQGGNQDLNQRKFALGAPQARAGNAVRGDTLANVQDASVSGLPSRISVPTIGGGVRPSILSSDTRQLGQQMSRDALLGQMAGDKFAPAPTLAPVNPLPQANALDKTLSTSGLAASLLKAALGDGGKAASGGGGDLGTLAKKIAGMFGGGDSGGDNIFGGKTTFTTDPAGSVDTSETMGAWPEQGGPGDTPVDPAQFGQSEDPTAAYYAWLASQGNGGDDSYGSGYGSGPSDTWGG